LSLKKYRPDLSVFTIATPPSGLTVVTGLDAGSKVLKAHYDQIVSEALAMPFAAMEHELWGAFNVVPADFSSVERLLGERRSVRA
jgi:hypothetical protein